MITQSHISSSLIYFHDVFRSKWNLSAYTNPEAPALFVGFYNHTDISLFNNHKGFKLALFGGADMPNVGRLKGNFKIVVDQFSYTHRLKKYYSGKIDKFIRVAWKDYSGFDPAPLGDKIYCYQNQMTEGNKAKYFYKELQRITEYFGPSMVIIGYHGKPMEYVKEQYYSNAFVNVQLNPMAGFTTSLEMAHMGRVSISNYQAPFCRGFSSIVDAIAYIRKVKNQPPDPKEVHQQAKDFVVSTNEWLKIDYWK
jgi:hypothetical protein